MRKTITRILLLLLCCAAVFTATACAKPSSTGGFDPAGEKAGGYTEDRALTADDLAVFEAAMENLLGVSYEPTLVATQVVAGTNYRFTTKATVVAPDAEPYTAYVYIFKPLSGDPELKEIVKDEAVKAE